MRDPWILLGMVLVAVAASSFFWTNRAVQIPRELTTFKSAEEPVTAAKDARARVRRFASVPTPPEPEPITPGPEPIKIISPAPVKAARPPITNVADVRVGMPSRRVLELLGNPDLSTTTILNGSLAETYIYTHAPDGQFIRIQLRGGRVAAEAP